MATPTVENVTGPPDQAEDTETIAAIDIGTNSVHMVVARVNPGGMFEVLTREKEMVRLGSGATDMKELAPDAMDRGVAALQRAHRLAETWGAQVAAVATSAVREAENRYEFLRRAREEAGVEVEVISGYEEARLIQLGVLQAVPVFAEHLLLCDIGGGSTELLLGYRGEVLAARSLKLGAIRLTRRFFTSSKLHPAAVDSCRRQIASMLAPMERAVEVHGYDVAVGSSGTIENLAAMALARRGEEIPQTLNNHTFTRDDIDVVIAELAGAKTVAKRRQLPGLDPQRADIVLAGALILEQVMHVFDIDEMLVSDYALREGVLLDTMQRLRGSTLHHLHDLRRQSVLHLMEQCDEDPAHSQHVAELALGLFDELSDVHGLGDQHRELLEAAALLANVGLFISHSKHHKHTYYVIRNSEQLTGFTDHEIELIALVARYHRKSEPKEKHEEFAALSADDKRLVRTLAGILRLAIGLDRTHRQTVTDTMVKVGEDQVTIVIGPAGDVDLSLELYTANERSGLLSKQVGLDVEIVQAPG